MQIICIRKLSARKIDNQQMAKQKQTPKPEANKPAAKKSTASVGKKYFTKRFYIPGFGFVDAGDLCTKEALAAWKKKSKVKIDAYLTKNEIG